MENVFKVFDKDVVAVNNVCLDIDDGEFIVLVGPSGCGKSTTLRMIAGLETISHGDIYIDDELVNDKEAKDRDIAMVFQSYALYPHMTIRQNIAFPLVMRNVKRDEINMRVENVAETLGLSDLLERKPQALSGGQRQRVALGRAMVRKPKVFLLDEPLSNLDAKLRVSMRSEIVKLQKRLGTTFIYVTHDQIEAMTMGDRIAVLRDGLLEQFDTPGMLFNFPKNKFVAQFIGSPSMNIFEVNITEEDGDMYAENMLFKLKLHTETISRLKGTLPEKALLGLRPNSFSKTKELTEDAFEIEIRDLENMGVDSYVLFEFQNQAYTAKILPEYENIRGDSIILKVDMSEAYLFDKESELNLLEPKTTDLYKYRSHLTIKHLKEAL